MSPIGAGEGWQGGGVINRESVGCEEPPDAIGRTMRRLSCGGVMNMFRTFSICSSANNNNNSSRGRRPPRCHFLPFHPSPPATHNTHTQTDAHTGRGGEKSTRKCACDGRHPVCGRINSYICAERSCCWITRKELLLLPLLIKRLCIRSLDHHFLMDL